MISISFRFSPVSRRAFLFSISPSFFQKKIAQERRLARHLRLPLDFIRLLFMRRRIRIADSPVMLGAFFYFSAEQFTLDPFRGFLFFLPLVSKNYCAGCGDWHDACARRLGIEPDIFLRLRLP